MTALATSDNSTTDKNVMSISTNARIDYILKFSRHVVVVLDDQQSGFGSISGTYLESLSDQSNAALVPVSSKLNDVQVRARINEQLFPGEAFDPEISLTQSVIEHYINQQLPIAIVIEHAHHLSLQIVHELTLLAELAKKSGREIAVVLLGQAALGKMIVTNHNLFNKKLSMISAANGQLISVNSALFSSKTSFLSLTPFNKLVIALVILLALTFATLYILYQRDAMTFSQLPEPKQPLEESSLAAAATESATLANSNSEQSSLAASVEYTSEVLTNNQVLHAKSQVAHPEEILIALMSTSDIIVEAGPAAPSDVLSALASISGDSQSENQSETQTHTQTQAKALTESHANNQSIQQTQATKKAALNTSVVTQSDVALESSVQQTGKSSDETENTATATQYFDTRHEGVVIQFTTQALTGVTKAGGASAKQSAQSLAAIFAQQHQLTHYQYYIRLMNEKPFVVVTSTTYPKRAEALSAMKQLSAELQQSGIWIKSTKTVKTEIAASQR